MNCESAVRVLHVLFHIYPSEFVRKVHFCDPCNPQMCSLIYIKNFLISKSMANEGASNRSNHPKGAEMTN